MRILVNNCEFLVDAAAPTHPGWPSFLAFYERRRWPQFVTSEAWELFLHGWDSQVVYTEGQQ